MYIILSIILSCLVPSKENGLYLITESNNCVNELVKFEMKAFCLATDPLIPLSDFYDVTAVKSEGTTSFFDLKFKPHVIQKIEKLLTSSLKPRFAVMLQHEVVGTVAYDEESNLSFLRFYTNDSSSDINYIHEAISQEIKNEE